MNRFWCLLQSLHNHSGARRSMTTSSFSCVARGTEVDFRLSLHGGANTSECHRPPTERWRLQRRRICQSGFPASEERRNQPLATTASTWLFTFHLQLYRRCRSLTLWDTRCRSMLRYAKTHRGRKANAELRKHAAEMWRERSHLLPTGSCSPREPPAHGPKLSKANKSVGASQKKKQKTFTQSDTLMTDDANTVFALPSTPDWYCRSPLTIDPYSGDFFFSSSLLAFLSYVNIGSVQI